MNFIGDEGADRVRAAYPDPVWRRLTEPGVPPIDWSPIDARLAAPGPTRSVSTSWPTDQARGVRIFRPTEAADLAVEERPSATNSA